MLLLGLLLAACAPAVYVTPGAIGPAELVRLSDSATNTAAAEARLASAATATDQSARATSTAAAQGTQDALAVRQTESALQLTQSAGQAMATDEAGVKTQGAQQTRAAGTPTAAAVAAAIRASATALARREADDAAGQARSQAIGDARGWLLLAVGILFLLGLAAAVVFGVSDILSARARLMHAAAARASAEARQMWIMQYGGVLLQLRGGAGWEIMPAPQIAGPVIDVVAGGPSPVREVPFRAKDGTVNLVDIAEPETPERERVLQLLDRAVSIVGTHASFIPSADRLGIHPQDWQLAVDKLKAGPDRAAYVVTSLGRPKSGQAGRTRLCQPAYLTLGALRDGVRRGDVLPRPEPEPAEAEPGNIQNAHFETS